MELKSSTYISMISRLGSRRGTIREKKKKKKKRDPLSDGQNKTTVVVELRKNNDTKLRRIRLVYMYTSEGDYCRHTK